MKNEPLDGRRSPSDESSTTSSTEEESPKPIKKRPLPPRFQHHRKNNLSEKWITPTTIASLAAVGILLILTSILAFALGAGSSETTVRRWSYDEISIQSTTAIAGLLLVAGAFAAGFSRPNSRTTGGRDGRTRGSSTSTNGLGSFFSAVRLLLQICLSYSLRNSDVAATLKQPICKRPTSRDYADL